MAGHADDVDRGADSVVEIRTTFADRAAAESCAARLVRERLAACVQIDGPVISTYRWRDVVETATEWRCTCKTSPGRAEGCRRAIAEGHPYETPEILVSPAVGSAAYAAWVRASVGDTGAVQP